MKMFFLLFLSAMIAVWSPIAPCESTERGAVSGKIEILRAKVKAKGPKHGKDVVVFLIPDDGNSDAGFRTHAVMDQRGLVFIPHVLAIQKGTRVDFLNSDNDRHNVYFLFDDTGDTLDIGTWGPGQSVSHRFERAGLVITLCQLHLEMAAYILVLDTPFISVAKIDAGSQQANYRIADLPAGTYTLDAWHKKLRLKGGAVSVKVAAGQDVTINIVMTKGKYAK